MKHSGPPRQAVVPPDLNSTLAPSATSTNLSSSDFETRSAGASKVMGPVATLIIDDEVTAMGADRDSFPRDRVAELLEKVGAEIADEDKRASFQKIILKVVETLR